MFHKKINLPDREESCFDSYKSTGTGGNQGSERTGLLEDGFVYFFVPPKAFMYTKYKERETSFSIIYRDFLKINVISKIVA